MARLISYCNHILASWNTKRQSVLFQFPNRRQVLENARYLTPVQLGRSYSKLKATTLKLTATNLGQTLLAYSTPSS